MTGWDADAVTREGLSGLVRAGLLDQTDWDRVIGDVAGGSAVDALIAEGLVTEEQVAQAVADAMGVAYVFPHPGACDLELCDAVSPDLLRGHAALPLVRDGEEVVVAFASPPSPKAVDALSRAFSAVVAPVLATRRKLERALEVILPPAPPSPEPERGGARCDGPGPDPAALTVLFGALARAVARDASEVRFEPRESVIVVRERGADGLREVDRVPRSAAAALVQRARILAGGAAGGHGPFGPSTVATRIGDRAVHLRVTVRDGDPRGPAVHLTIRRGSPPVTLSEYPLSELVRDQLASVCAGRRGLVLVSSGSVATARALGRAVSEAACAEVRGCLIVVDPALRPPEPAAWYLASDVAAAVALEPDVLLVAAGLGAAALDNLLRCAERAVVVLVGGDSEPLDAILGLLEQGARQSLVARALALSVAVSGRAPFRVRTLRPEPAARARLAIGDRAGFCAQLTGETLWT